MPLSGLLLIKMSYKKIKWVGAIFWALTYICFIVIANNFHFAMIPLIVCSYNISYELIYTIKAEDRSQRLRNGLWFMLDIYIIYYHVTYMSSISWFIFWFSIFAIIQLVSTYKLGKSTVKGAAWVVTCLMSIILISTDLPISMWVTGAILFKTLGDGFYGVAHLYYGLPEKETINGTYYSFIQFCIILSFVLNFFLLYNY
jgi:hypothetical protein